MNLSLARVDGGPLMALRGETANGEWRTASGERRTGNEHEHEDEDEDEGRMIKGEVKLFSRRSSQDKGRPTA